MLIVFLVIAIGLCILGVLTSKPTEDDNTDMSFVCFCIGFGIIIFLIIPFFIGIINLSKGRIIDQKIEMYIEENTKIETSVTTTVEKYLEHEFNIFDTLQGEDIQTLLVVYPEINSNELVKKQVEIFVENNNMIKQLKEEKLNIKIWRWWVYFG